MSETPEQLAREHIDALLIAAGWAIQDYRAFNPGAARGIALREVPLASGRCDYLLLVDRLPLGVIEAKKEGTTLSTVSEQSAHYGENLPDFLANLLPGTKKIPFAYESTGIETLFRDERDPHPRSRRIFAFHQPPTLAAWLTEPDTLRARLAALPAAHPLPATHLRACQIEAITALEASFAADRPRALIQMATGAGKTYTACAFTYRLIKFAGARRVLFLVDRGIRRQLLQQADVHTLLRLPTGIFYAQGVKANVLFFDRKPAADKKAWTEKLRIYDLRTNQHFTLKENTLKRSDLDDFVACYFGRLGKNALGSTRSTSRHDRKESERFKSFTYDELIKRDKVNLDIFWLKDDALEDSANLPAPGIIAADIVADLEAALEQFAAIEEDLKE